VARLCSIDEIDTVITGDSAESEVLTALREQSCEVLVAD
jgi:DeoR/GlpR family transcriptional regulator of sugar metabolism